VTAPSARPAVAAGVEPRCVNRDADPAHLCLKRAKSDQLASAPPIATALGLAELIDLPTSP
jgi:hypothetical protein